MKPCATVCFLLAVCPALGQWSADPGTNLVIGDRSGEQVQPKVRALPDGSCYISWLDNAAGGYDTYLQRLDAAGVEQWPHNGLRITDFSQSSTQDYGLDVDADGNALIAFRSDLGGTIQISAQKVAPDGTFLWGTNGVQVTNDSGISVNNPKITALDDGTVVVGWSQATGIGLQKLSAAGSPLWAAGGILSAPATGSYGMSDVKPGGDGAVIVLMQRPLGANPVTSNKHLATQKFDASGTPLWNEGTPLVIFDANSIQNGYFPTFEPDGAGGAVYGWYERGGSRNALLQRVRSDGVEMYTHNGVPANTTAGKDRLSPWMAYDAATDTAYMAWTQTNITIQNSWGVYAQKFVGGVRQWGDDGIEILPQTADQNSFVRCTVSGDGVMVAWFEKPGNSRVLTTRLDSAGAASWIPAIREVTSVLTSKGRLDMAGTAGGCAYLTWHDGRGTANDIIAQAVTADGDLGPCPAASCPADFNNDGGVDGADVEAFYIVWEAGEAGADVNGDGGIDGGDVETFFAAWEAGGCG